MAQTQGRYPLIDPKHAAGTLWGIWEMRNSIDFLKNFNTLTEVGTIQPYLRLTHHRYQLLGHDDVEGYLTADDVIRYLAFSFK